jgi:hypothetical protein
MLKILDYINLLVYDDRLEQLAGRLAQSKKTHYEHDEKIVILHEDTEYFYHGVLTGFTTHNLFTIIRQLDIPLFVFVFITNQNQFQKSIAPFITDSSDAPEIYNLITGVTAIHGGKQDKIKNLLEAEPPKDIRFHAVCLLGTRRNHRIKLFQFLKHSGLDQYINFSFNDKNVSILSNTINDSDPQNFPTVDNLVFSTPHRINESWLSRSTALTHLDHIETASTTNPWIDSSGVDFYQHYAIDIVTETVFDYPHVFVSEKTLRPIALKTAFVMFGAVGTLAYLKQHGFKTFSDFWDESYDSIADPHARFLACCDVLTGLSQLSIIGVKEMYDAMLPILEHNKQTLVEYVDNVFDPLYNKFNLDNFLGPSRNFRTK